MEQEYVIGVRNKFAGFLEEGEDPYDILKNVEAENKKKKALKVSISNENKENKSKDANEVKSKAVKKPAAIKATDRVLPGTGERGAKPDSAAPADRPNRRNKEESADFPRTGSFRDGNKPDGSRGPRNDNRDGPRGERRDRDGPRPFRDERERRGPRPEGDRPFRQRDGAGSDGEGRPPRRERREFGQDSGFDGESRPERRTGGPRGRGSRPPGRSFEGRGGKREFDRRSGSDRTGVKPVEKRDGAGSFNWDSTKDCEALIPDLNETNTSDEPDWNNTPTTDADAAPAPKENDENEEVAAPVEEEPQELTLDEYRKLRGTRERPQFDIRKPGEGEDLSQWKNMIEIKKKEDKVEEEEFELADIPQRAGRQKHVVIDITFNDVFRGGRGRGRGRGGREGRDNRDREPREFREPREPREFREPREPREYREPREPREFREPREPREYREPREPRGDRAERGDGPPQRRFPPREERRGGGSAYEDRGRPSVPKVDDEKAFPSLG